MAEEEQEEAASPRFDLESSDPEWLDDDPRTEGPQEPLVGAKEGEATSPPAQVPPANDDGHMGPSTAQGSQTAETDQSRLEATGDGGSEPARPAQATQGVQAGDGAPRTFEK